MTVVATLLMFAGAIVAFLGLVVLLDIPRVIFGAAVLAAVPTLPSLTALLIGSVLAAITVRLALMPVQARARAKAAAKEARVAPVPDASSPPKGGPHGIGSQVFSAVLSSWLTVWLWNVTADFFGSPTLEPFGQAVAVMVAYSLGVTAVARAIGQLRASRAADALTS